MRIRNNKKAQEEIVGFALIVVIVAVVLLVFLVFSLKKPANEELIESYEAHGFVASMLQYTSNCSRTADIDYYSTKGLIYACKTKAKCYDERDSCDVLNQDIKRIVEEVGSIYNPVIPAIQAGNETLNYKNAVEVLSGGIRVFFNAYY